MPFLCVNLAFQKACLCMKNDKYQVWFMCHKSQEIKQNESRQIKSKFWFQVWPGIGQAQTDSSGSCFVFPHLRNIFYLVIMTDLFNQQFYKIYLLLMMKFTRPHMKGWLTVVPSVESSLTRFLTENDMSSVTRFPKSSKGWRSQNNPQDNDTFECEDCHKMFKNEKNLRHHYKTHHELPHPKKTTGASAAGKPESSEKVHYTLITFYLVLNLDSESNSYLFRNASSTHFNELFGWLLFNWPGC